MKCSVIILNWNGAQMLRQFLPSVTTHTKRDDCEIVVADNGSTDDSLRVLEAFPQVRSLALGHNYGFAEGYNRALARTEAEYSVLLNSDVEVTDGWLDTILAYMDTHPAVAACQPKIRSFVNRNYFEHAGAAGGYIDELGYPYCRGRILNHVEEDKGQYDDIAEVFWATGACLCIRTSLYKACGGLDAGFFAHMEEIDLCWRLQCRGWKIACIPQSIVYHVGGGALSYGSPRKTYLNFRNNLLMIYKNAPTLRMQSILFIRFWLDYIAALQYLLTGKKAHAQAVVRARIDFLKMLRGYGSHRKENLRLCTVPIPAAIRKRSIILSYYLFQEKIFR